MKQTQKILLAARPVSLARLSSSPRLRCAAIMAAALLLNSMDAFA
jgi:hypothetical protein